MAAATVEVKGVRPTVVALKKWEPEARRELRRALRAAGMEVVSEARARVAPFSRKTPPTIRTGTRIRSFEVEVAVRAGRPGVEIATLLEKGNKGGKSEEFFKHPVWGHRDRPWAKQAMHPYLGPAFRAKQATFLQRIVEALDAATVKLDL